MASLVEFPEEDQVAALRAALRRLEIGAPGKLAAPLVEFSEEDQIVALRAVLKTFQIILEAASKAALARCQPISTRVQ